MVGRLACLLLLIVSIPVYAEGALIFKFYSQVILGAKRLTIGDIGRVLGKNAQLDKYRDVLKQPLGDDLLRALNRSRGSVPRRRLESYIRECCAQSLGAMRFAGAPVVSIRNLMHLRDAGKVVSAAKLFLRGRLPEDVNVLAIDYVGRTLPALPKGGTINFSMPPINDYRRVVVWAEQKNVGRFSLWFHVSGNVEAWVVNQEVKTGEVVEPQQMQLRIRELKDIPANVFKGTPSWFRLRYVVDASPGRALTDDLVQPLPAVLVGEKVKVLSHVGRVTVNGVAEALNEAKVGDKVRLRSLSSDEIYFAKVTGPGLAEVGRVAETQGANYE